MLACSTTSGVTKQCARRTQFWSELIQQHTKAFDDDVLAHADIDSAHVE